MPRRQLNIDPWIPALTLTLLGIGLVMIYSASATRALADHGSSWHFTLRQMVWAGMGLFALTMGTLIDYRNWERLAAPMLMGVMILLALTLIPGIGLSAGGARRWLGIGPFRLQASELAKFVCTVYMASYLAHHGKWIRAGSISAVLRPLLLIGTILGMIVVEPDLGNAVAICAVSGALLFTAGLSWALIGGLFITAGGCIALAVLSEGYRMQRIAAYLDPWADPTGSGYQMVQSFTSFGSGGILGQGLGEGGQKLFFLPEAHTDFIFAVIGEELGLIGALIILTLFALFAWRGICISREADSPFGAYLALGLTMMVVLQALIHMGVTVGALPNKGLPLPFVSYGGSALLINLFVVGVLINVSRGRRGRRGA